jgi:predicted histone-like DNA-binding protein
MAISFTASGKTNPNNPAALLQYYPRAVNNGEINLEELADNLAKKTTLSVSDCYGVIIGLVAEIEHELSNGKIVRIDRLGSFQISIKGNPEASALAVNAKNITKSSIIYRPSKMLKSMLGKLKYNKIG